jgi:hypothetical protein
MRPLDNSNDDDDSNASKMFVLQATLLFHYAV